MNEYGLVYRTTIFSTNHHPHFDSAHFGSIRLLPHAMAQSTTIHSVESHWNRLFQALGESPFHDANDQFLTTRAPWNYDVNNLQKEATRLLLCHHGSVENGSHIWKEPNYWRDPFLTSMIMGGSVSQLTHLGRIKRTKRTTVTIWHQASGFPRSDDLPTQISVVVDVSRCLQKKGLVFVIQHDVKAKHLVVLNVCLENTVWTKCVPLRNIKGKGN